MLAPNTRRPHLMTRAHRVLEHRGGRSGEVQLSIGMHAQQTSSEVNWYFLPSVVGTVFILPSVAAYTGRSRLFLPRLSAG